jgi:hypothetical protein
LLSLGTDIVLRPWSAPMLRARRRAWLARAALPQPARLWRGEVLVHEGQPASGVYLLRTGRVGIALRGPEGRSIDLGTAGPGEAIGELAALGGGPHSATVVALGPVVADYVPQDGFLAALAASPEAMLRLHRVPGMDDVVPTAAQVFQMATENGAMTTGFADTIGTLEPGKAADLVIMNWRQIAYPYLDPGVPVVDAVVHRAKTSAVETVLVAGEAVPRDGQFTRVNKADMLEALAASLRAPLQPAEERRRALSPAVFPYVKHFYDGWLDEKARDPFYRPSSRH